MYDSYAEFHGWDDDDDAFGTSEAVPVSGGGGQGDPPPGADTDRAELMARLATALTVRTAQLEGKQPEKWSYRILRKLRKKANM
jgi:hypothetical protein